jgi:hypothetical protein
MARTKAKPKAVDLKQVASDLEGHEVSIQKLNSTGMEGICRGVHAIQDPLFGREVDYLCLETRDTTHKVLFRVVEGITPIKKG